MILDLSKIRVNRNLRRDPSLKNLQIKSKKAGILGDLGKKIIRRDEAIKHMTEDLSKGRSETSMIQLLRKKYGFESSKGRKIIQSASGAGDQAKQATDQKFKQDKQPYKEIRKKTTLEEAREISEQRDISRHERELLRDKEAKSTQRILGAGNIAKYIETAHGAKIPEHETSAHQAGQVVEPTTAMEQATGGSKNVGFVSGDVDAQKKSADEIVGGKQKYQTVISEGEKKDGESESKDDIDKKPPSPIPLSN